MVSIEIISQADQRFSHLDITTTHQYYTGITNLGCVGLSRLVVFWFFLTIEFFDLCQKKKKKQFRYPQVRNFNTIIDVNYCSPIYRSNIDG